MPEARKLVLASTSPYRRELLSRLPLSFECVAPPFEEHPEPGVPPLETIEVFAKEKALSVCPLQPDAIIIGSDQGMIANGKLLGKPGTADAAFEQLKTLCGGTHTLATAVAVLDAKNGRCEKATEISRLTFRALPDDAIRRYVELDEPLDCAGSFKLESAGIALFESIDGDDPTNIIGLPLIRLVTLLERFDVSVLAP